jgi:hypothetical protein
MNSRWGFGVPPLHSGVRAAIDHCAKYCPNKIAGAVAKGKPFRKFMMRPGPARRWQGNAVAAFGYSREMPETRSRWG